MVMISIVEERTMLQTMLTVHHVQEVVDIIERKINHISYFIHQTSTATGEVFRRPRISCSRMTKLCNYKEMRIVLTMAFEI